MMKEFVLRRSPNCSMVSDMKRITYLKNAYKTLESYDKGTISRILNAISSIPRGDIKRLQGEKHPPLYRLRVGKYRIIYSIEPDELLVVKIDTRGDIYK